MKRQNEHGRRSGRDVNHICEEEGAGYAKEERGRL